MSKLDILGKILTSGWGSGVLLGILVGYLDNVTPEQCYKYIRDDKPLFQNVADEDWEGYRGMAQDAHAGEILNKETLILTLREHRLDLLSVIINHPGGEDWFDRQLVEVREKLAVDIGA